MLTRGLNWIIFLALFSCNIKLQNGQPCYKRTKRLVESICVHKFWDEYLILRAGGYFENYIRPFGTVRQQTYKGTYMIKSDSLFLAFCNGIIPGDLNGLGLL